jgi:hypothetical protein
MASEELHKTVESELREEKAAALGRVTHQFEVALAALEAAERALATASPQEREQRLAARHIARREAARWLWYVQVQRECLGLANHDQLLHIYRVPREVAFWAGATPHRRG